jgi:peroxiredoxin
MRIKHYAALFLLYAFAGCGFNHDIELDVTIPGLNGAVFTVSGESGKLFSENVVNGECLLKGRLEKPGFYTCVLKKNYTPGEKRFEVYLEPGRYNIQIDSHSHKYPHVHSASNYQQQVNNYRHIFDSLAPPVTPVKLLAYKTLFTYIKTYPQSELSAHFMAEHDYEDRPEAYKVLYDIMPPAAKNSDEGRYINKKLTLILKTTPGNKAPQIEGTILGGKTFNQITAGKKIILVDFWRAANYVSRINNDSLKRVYNMYKSKGFEIIGVSLDKRDLWWKTALKDDKLPWPQISDLKGSDSPNVTNWNATSIPTYYLVDEKWNILFPNIQLNSVEVEVRQYLEKHP